jgi:hypothetical protein
MIQATVMGMRLATTLHAKFERPSLKATGKIRTMRLGIARGILLARWIAGIEKISRGMSMKHLLVIVLMFLAFEANAETVNVKYRGTVDLATFDCNWIQRSSFINRLCYDDSERYVIVALNGTYYHYCEVPEQTISAWMEGGFNG